MKYLWIFCKPWLCKVVFAVFVFCYCFFFIYLWYQYWVKLLSSYYVVKSQKIIMYNIHYNFMLNDIVMKWRYCQSLSISLYLSLRDSDRADTIITFHTTTPPRSCKRSKTLFKSLLFWLAGEVSWLAVEVLSPCRK